ncbi:MAG: patatin-like phospholipase family protein [Bacteroidales bacterium]|nr:patatin-like phospholipase family protein [Bacteroidales bacterium]
MKRFAILVLSVLAMFAASAQDTIVEKTADTLAAADTTVVLHQRPRVGVVLSGGGAKGFAHIGALRVIEEAGIPIDYIAGTSMGSIIGGLYAVGYDPDMMQKLCTEQDWNLIIKDQIPRKFMPLEKRLNERHYLISFPRINRKFKIRRSMIDGMYVNMLLTRLTMPAYKERDFSKLPVPFLCIGTDLISADPIEFTSGSLAQSIRSSMSIPFLFEPVDYDGYLLCDGGLTNNFPVQNVRAKGADIIIGVDLEIIKSDPNVLDNSLKVLERLIAVVSQDKSNVARDECDILIRPDIGKANIMSFNDFSPIIDCGEKGAREKFPELKRLADSLQALGPFEVERHHTQPVDHITIASVEVEGVDDYEANLLKSEFGKEFPKEFKIDEIETIIVKTYSQGYYSNVWYELVDAPEGNILKLHCKQKTSLNFNVAGHYDNNYSIGFLLNMNARTKHFDYNVDLNLSDNPYFKARMAHRYTRVIRSGLELSAMNLRANLLTYKGSVFGTMRVQQNAADVYLQLVPSVTQTFKVGFRMDYTLVKDKTYSEYSSEDDYEHKLLPKLYAHYFFNNEDQTDFPRKGWNVNLIGKCIMYDGVFSSDEDRPIYCAQLDIRKSFPIGQNHALRLGAVGAVRLGEQSLTEENMFFVGGQSRMFYVDNILTFTGLPFISVYSEYAAYGRAAWQWNFYKNFYAVASCDAGYFKNFMDIVNRYPGILETPEEMEEYLQWLEDLLSNRLDTWFIPDNFIMGAGLSLGVKTPLGPIEVQVSKSNVVENWCLFVNVGYWF